MGQSVTQWGYQKGYFSVNIRFCDETIHETACTSRKKMPLIRYLMEGSIVPAHNIYTVTTCSAIGASCHKRLMCVKFTVFLMVEILHYFFSQDFKNIINLEKYSQKYKVWQLAPFSTIQKNKRLNINWHIFLMWFWVSSPLFTYLFKVHSLFLSVSPFLRL